MWGGQRGRWRASWALLCLCYGRRLHKQRVGWLGSVRHPSVAAATFSLHLAASALSLPPAGMAGDAGSGLLLSSEDDQVCGGEAGAVYLRVCLSPSPSV